MCPAREERAEAGIRPVETDRGEITENTSQKTRKRELLTKKHLIGAILVMAAVSVAVYLAKSGVRRTPSLPPADLSKLVAGDMVLVVRTTYECPSLAAMNRLHEDAVAHDEIGFANHFSQEHCQKIKAVGGPFRILGFSDGPAGARYVDVAGEKPQAGKWIFGAPGIFSLRSPKGKG